MNINLRHLQVLQAIRVHGGFARAAVELGVVPSALSETVRQMEEALGAPLFDRKLRPPAPTPLAQALCDETAPLLSGLDRAISHARALAGLETGLLTIGAAPSAITPLVGPALARFRAAHPAIRVRLHDNIAQELVVRLREGMLDLAVAGYPSPSPDIEATLLQRDPFGLACSRHHPLASRGQVSLQDIRPEEIISLNPDTGTQQQLCDAQLAPEFTAGPLHADSTVGQLCLIRAGLGVGLLPQNAVHLFGDPEIRFLTVTDLTLWRSLYLLTPANRAQSNLAVAFARILQDLPPQ